MTPHHHTREDRRLMLASSADERAVRINALKDYLARTGMHRDDFARKIGYASSSLRKYLTDNYSAVAGTAVHLERKIREYMDRNPADPETQVEGELFETANVRELRETFMKLLLRPRAFMVYAPPGSQKTFALKHMVHEFNRNERPKGASGAVARYVYCRQGCTPRALLKRIAVACGSHGDGDVDRIVQNLASDHRGRAVLLALDEAQHLSIECFETVRELLDEHGFSLLFAGSHDLFLKMDRAALSMEQLNSRVVHRLRLPGCGDAEARGIIEREIGGILAAKASESRRKQVIDTLIAKATVVDPYIAVQPGQPAATYLNIRTLCNALDDLKASAQKVSAA